MTTVKKSKKDKSAPKPKGKGRPKGSGIPVTDELFAQKIEERLSRINSQFTALNRINTSRWQKLPNHTHNWNAVIRHLQHELEKLKITAEAPTEISEIFEKFGNPEEILEVMEETEETEGEETSGFLSSVPDALLEIMKEDQRSADWVVVVSLPGFLRSFREHAKSLYLEGLETMQENIEYTLEGWTCPFAGIDEEIESEGYRRNSELFEFIGYLLTGMLEVIRDLTTEEELGGEEYMEEDIEEDLPGSGALPLWERKAVAFYHGQVG